MESDLKIQVYSLCYLNTYVVRLINISYLKHFSFFNILEKKFFSYQFVFIVFSKVRFNNNDFISTNDSK